MANVKEDSVNWLGDGVDKDKVGVPVPVGNMKLVEARGSGTLELIMRDGEPAVIVDGQHVIRRSTLVRQLADAVAQR